MTLKEKEFKTIYNALNNAVDNYLGRIGILENEINTSQKPFNSEKEINELEEKIEEITDPLINKLQRIKYGLLKNTETIKKLTGASKTARKPALIEYLKENVYPGIKKAITEVDTAVKKYENKEKKMDEDQKEFQIYIILNSLRNAGEKLLIAGNRFNKINIDELLPDFLKNDENFKNIRRSYEKKKIR